MLPKSLENFIELFSKVPGIGLRQAHRIAFWFLKKNSLAYSQALKDLAEKVRVCQKCFFVFDPSTNSGKDIFSTCPICRDEKRDRLILAIVEKETDLITLEKTKRFNGLYFVLGGLFSPTIRNGHEIRLKELLERIKNDKNLKEIILALSHTAEGDLTVMELEKIFNQFKSLKLTRLGLGLPRGAEVEFADEDTLGNALSSRR
ncbi:MAG: hypothetical protein A2418_02640 [Candidatus Brennerbacteria bacterium RIFOXYC1_FULL_41_11]|uniref:Recombination protein RecR n=1 Tax=Candidatus Brennerbacteria bacterium RIFOXYD1_FULL_41_16 TaxID=1797529 RepID=A0A1G1XKU5_9BACT|nr:MAG: Recombination protein RecR [Parcubacteria group bacterium GW2011_GWB1_41_4]OGY38794.1 MAG: hypothetical protein A2391_02395 [Candidatus Brennerbacteria bacterium RIFOXYB1_FULL_41_13]OGY39077.1 MAG: hypothetical protein A2418_02640 [Candidatus Brennerbacteria bacterium RIFOXYC1_FULL_41_11]OGY40230.1 MAG: hypothetical protein A2570_03020 [Candidatus Brennerbacteria bacterium RIFOXYD1_FULL_41_16]